MYWRTSIDIVSLCKLSCETYQKIPNRCRKCRSLPITWPPYPLVSLSFSRFLAIFLSPSITPFHWPHACVSSLPLVFSLSLGLPTRFRSFLVSFLRGRMRATAVQLFQVGIASIRNGPSTRPQHLRQVKGLPYLLSQASIYKSKGRNNEKSNRRKSHAREKRKRNEVCQQSGASVV